MNYRHGLVFIVMFAFMFRSEAEIYQSPENAQVSLVLQMSTNLSTGSWENLETNRLSATSLVSDSSFFRLQIEYGNSATNPIAYEKAVNWLSLPAAIKDVDVFYVYPTVSHNTNGVMDITDPNKRALAAGIWQAQASVFELEANIFAPYYRQMSTKVVMEEGEELATDTDEFKQGAIDVQDAFNYYIANFNNNRPLILAGHSQGTMALIELIKNRFGDDETLRSRLVAAYLIGYTVTDADLAAAGLTAATNATDTGVIITYNSQSATAVTNGPMLMAGAHCINPLNWTTDDTAADASQNLGAVFFDDATGTFEREVPNYCGAQIDLSTGALTTIIPPGENLDIGPYADGVYHRFDYAFWYRNLQSNVTDRINAYFSEP